jgi:tetratricopeptide (TPR) repeat protein
LFGGFNEKAWDEHFQEAQFFARQGQFSEAIGSMQKAVECALRPGGEEALVETYVTLGHLQMQLSRFDLAQQAYEHGVEAARAAAGPRAQLVAGALTFLANCHEEQGQYDRSAQTYRQAISLLEELPPTESSQRLLRNSRANLASVLGNLGQGAEALVLNQQVVDAERREEEPSGLAVALWTRSTLASRQGLHDEAIQAAREALELARKWLEPDDPQVFRALHQYSNILVKAGRAQEAVPLLEEGLWQLHAAGIEDPIFEATWMESLADALLEAGRFEESERWYQRSLEYFTRIHGPRHQNLISAVEGYCELLRRQGREAELREQQNRLEEIRAALPPELAQRSARK